MKYRAAAGNSPCNYRAVFFNLADPAFLPNILVLADYDGVLILPQIQNRFIPPASGKQIFLDCQILMWIYSCTFDIRCLLIMSFPFRLLYNLPRFCSVILTSLP